MSKKKKILIIRLVLFLSTAISLFYVPWILVRAWIMPLPDSVEQQLQQGINYGFDGMIVYMDKAGNEPEFYAAGWHDRNKKIPAYPQALFKIASITKLYIAVATTKLVAEGRLDLNKTLAEYFPELENRIENSREITLRMMIQHRSGIPNFVDHPDYWVKPPKNRQETLEYALDLPANFAPNKDYGYSNTNYMLIEDLLDKTLGYAHQQFIRERILNPLGLKNTYGSIDEVENMNDIMSGYYVGLDTDFKNEITGLMIASAEDVGKFIRALNDGSVFTANERVLYPYVYNHTGLIPGYQSIAEYHKDDDMVVVQFNNTTNFLGYDWNLAEIIYNRVVEIGRKK